MNDDPKNAMIAELRLLAGAQGDDFALVWEGVHIAVSFEGEDNPKLTLTTAYDGAARSSASAQGYRAQPEIRAIRPMNILATVERSADREAKRAGVNTEFQTGDERFDAAVYIDSPTRNEVLAQVLNDEVRAAVLALLSMDIPRVEIDVWPDYSLSVSVTRFVSSPTDPTPGRTVLSALAALARGVPRVVATGDKHRNHPLLGPMMGLFAASLLVIMLGLGLYFSVLSGSRCQGDLDGPALLRCVRPGLWGVLVGLAIAGTITAMVRPWMRKRFGLTSDSSAMITGFLVALTIFVTLVTGLFATYRLAH
ncbi:MAG: hypothetical protein Q8Q09_28085 [Deltaproteobacteria bacterium]|nr:hypothetical protein [Deltaproteobacteria bacterium]